MAQALILAAGHGRRMGSTKALVELCGEPFLARILRLLADFELAVCVTGTAHEEIQSAFAGHATPPRLAWARNPDPDRGRTSSIQAGLPLLRDGEPFLLWPVDLPCVQPRTLQGLCASPTGAREWRIPCHGGRRGHPVWLGGGIAPLIARLAPERPLRALLASPEVEVREHPTGDRGVRLDLNTRDELRAAEAWLRGSQ